MRNLLRDRVLWHDGTVEVDPHMLDSFLHVPSDKLAVSYLTDEIRQFNQLSDEPIAVAKAANKPINTNWSVPAVDIDELIQQRLLETIDPTDPRAEDRVQRAMHELAAYKARNMYPLLSALVWVVNTFESTNTVWGIGRGSSVASYILYLLKVHDVDPIEYELDFADFMR